jgi:hypothetical protein
MVSLIGAADSSLQIAGLDRVPADADVHKPTSWVWCTLRYNTGGCDQPHTPEQGLLQGDPLALSVRAQAKVHQEPGGRAGKEDIIRERPNLELDLVRLAHRVALRQVAEKSRTAGATTGRRNRSIMCLICHLL